MKKPDLRTLVFYGIALFPVWLVLGVVVYFVFLTNALPIAYRDYVRNINFDCFEVVDQPYVYRMVPGECRFDNLEYQTVQTIDDHGFRNARPKIAYDARTVILGDSHAYGFSVNDEDTLQAQLKQRHGIDAVNLAVTIYATSRELSAAEAHAPSAQTVVIQYCENDLGENAEYLEFPPEKEPEVRQGVLQNIREAKEVYHARKGQESWLDGPRSVLQVIRQREYLTRWEMAARERARDYDNEAQKFASILQRHKAYLDGRRLVVFESSSFGSNSPRFKPAFEKAIRAQLPGLRVDVLDSTTVVDKADYFRFDDHPRPSAYRKFADLLAPYLSVGA